MRTPLPRPFPGETALVAGVLSTSAAQQQLVPALMGVYGAADFVVGLDVDRDDYDKFSVRYERVSNRADCDSVCCKALTGVRRCCRRRGASRMC